MDGTLIDSSAGLEGAWEAFKETYPHIDVPHILEGAHVYRCSCPSFPTNHLAGSQGVRTMDNLRDHCGITDPELLEVRVHFFSTANFTHPFH